MTPTDPDDVEQALVMRDQEWVQSIDLAIKFLLSEPGPVDRGVLVYELRAAAERLGAIPEDDR